MLYINLKHLFVSRFVLGSNPFSGFSHQGEERDNEMRHYFSSSHIKDTLRAAETLNINTVIARTDFHVMRTLMEYWDEGGKMQWFAQTCSEVGDHEVCIKRAEFYGAKAVHIHGGVMDNLLALDRLDDIPPMIDLIHRKGMLAGVAAHNHRVFEWAEKHLPEVDYYMCCYYNPIPREENPEHVSGTEEQYLEKDRNTMTSLIQTLSKPVVHYKILAAGRTSPREAFAYAASKMRPSDAVCVGVYPKDDPAMLNKDVQLLLEHL